jgi:hypothetical protein
LTARHLARVQFNWIEEFIRPGEAAFAAHNAFAGAGECDYIGHEV